MTERSSKDLKRSLKELTVFDIIKNISYTKEDLSSQEGFRGAYNSYIINRALAQHIDCILYVNEINKYPFIDNTMKYQFLINSIRKRSRWKPWVKKENSEDLEFIMNTFNINERKAKVAMSLLSPKQFKTLKAKVIKNKGGVKNE